MSKTKRKIAELEREIARQAGTIEKLKTLFDIKAIPAIPLNIRFPRTKYVFGEESPIRKIDLLLDELGYEYHPPGKHPASIKKKAKGEVKHE